MAQYTIKDIEKLTGIKAHTIRIWEQRYGVVEPHRTETNIRFYDDDQLKMLLNISILVRNGKKISAISSLSTEELAKETLELLQDPGHPTDAYFSVQIDGLVVAMMELDEARFEKIISNGTLRYGFETVMLRILIPFLQKVGLLWTAGEISVAQEHFITHLIRRKLIVAIDGQVLKYSHPQRFLLFLPEDELHELGLLFAKYLIKSRGFRVVYLGQAVPMHDVVVLKDLYQPDFMLTYFTSSYQSHKIQQDVNKLSQAFPTSQLLVCGPVMRYYKGDLPENVKFLAEIEDLLGLLNHL